MEMSQRGGVESQSLLRQERGATVMPQSTRQHNMPSCLTRIASSEEGEGLWDPHDKSTCLLIETSAVDGIGYKLSKLFKPTFHRQDYKELQIFILTEILVHFCL
ncbi:hypothetical protein EVAR_82793_1 [Eumeta japonica]|uniref:Uncharacterized protein n=1 Tax=Eumeta variegata TaxID=151549 RepID=A0A4C1UPH7_EUMVA|nr:hypothetical protein EVAR_82793_1 [Eumeta japonica]